MSTTDVRFTPECLIETPRRSSAIPNHNGTKFIYSVSSYSLVEHKKVRQIMLWDKTSEETTLITDDSAASCPQWLQDDVMFLRTDKSKQTSLVVFHTEVQQHCESIIATIPTKISSFKVHSLGSGKFAFVAACKTDSKGNMIWDPVKASPWSSAMVYDSLLIREWDSYVGLSKNSLFYGLLEVRSTTSNGTKDYTLSKLNNALSNTDLESPTSPSCRSDDYDVCSQGIIFVARDTDFGTSDRTTMYAFIKRIKDFQLETDTGPQRLESLGCKGIASYPRFSPDGNCAVYLHMEADSNDSSRNQLLYLQHVFSREDVICKLLKLSMWDLSSDMVEWSFKSESIYMIAEEQGRRILWKLDLASASKDDMFVPQKLTFEHSVIDISPIVTADYDLYLSSSSFTENSYWHLLDSSKPGSLQLLSANLNEGKSIGLNAGQVSSFWVDCGDHKVHCWLLRPRNFFSRARYPLAMMVHGGPQQAWIDGWSTRWNPAVFAEQGYIVVAPNITGSTSYGQAFTDSVTNQWGGKPYDDLVVVLNHLESQPDFQYIDTKRMVALGGSYGAYLLHWVNGQELGRRFKAFVCHDGYFDLMTKIATDQMFFPIHEMNGLFWASNANRADWERWSPARFVQNWKTPVLIIHGENDYRVPVTEGISAFQAAQLKGLKSRFLHFPDENHWVLKEENSLVWHIVVINWINQHVGLEKYGQEPKSVQTASRTLV